MKKQLLFIILTLFVYFFLLSSDIHAEETGIMCSGKEGTYINTAIGCIPVNSPSELTAFFLRWAVGVGGGIAFILMVVAGFTIMTSAGNPERLKGGQQLLTSAVSGLIMIIFSVFILRLIGVDILQISSLRIQ